MFSLTITDHLHLDAERVAQNYTLHARAAERLVPFALTIRIAIVALLVLATAASIADLLFQTRADRITAVAATSLALVGFTLYAVLGLEARVAAHRSFAQRLWLMSERYRSLMAEVEEGIVDHTVLLERRDELISELYSIYESGFAADQAGYENARLAPLKNDRAPGIQPVALGE